VAVVEVVEALAGVVAWDQVVVVAREVGTREALV
jgi:hypothetical protein